MTRCLLKIVFLTFFVACVIAPAAWAEKSYKTIESVGLATSADKALAKALNNAVSQVNGSVVSQKISIEETDDRIRLGLFGHSLVIPSKEINTGFTQSYSEGVIKSYLVTDSSYNEINKTYRLVVQAEVEYLAEYENIGIDRSHLMPLVVTDFKVQSKTLEGLNGPELATAVSRRLSDNLTQLLSQTEQFRLLDRTNLPRLLIEQLINQSLGAKTGQQINLEQQLSAELMVVGNIKNFNISTNTVNSYGTDFDNYFAELRLDIRVIETATGDIRLAKQFEQYLSHDEIKQQLQKFQKNIFTVNKASDKRRVQYAIETVLMQEVGLAIVKKFFPKFDAKKTRLVNTSMSGTLNSAEPVKNRTPTSDSPGSSEKPVKW